MTELRQIRDKHMSLTQLRNEGIVNSYHRLDVQQNPIKYSKKRDETVLIEGEFKGHTADKPHTVIRAVEVAEFSGVMKVEAGATIQGVTFKGDAVLAEVTGTMPAMFRDCTFIRDASTNLTTAFVTVASGAKATFSGCRFRSAEDTGVMQGAGNVVYNDAANAATDVSVVACVNETGWSHSNATVLGEV